jgi:hypothetical protein
VRPLQLPADLLARTGWSSRQAEQLYIGLHDVQTQRMNFSHIRTAAVMHERRKTFTFRNVTCLFMW